MKATHFFLFFSFLFILVSCSDNDEVLETVVLVQTEETYIIASEEEDFINIKVESLIDITDNRKGPLNNTDYCNITIDINSNNEIDSDVDFGYESPTDKYDICSYYLLDSGAITHCGGHPTTALFTETFAASEANSTPHMIWNLRISKEELNYERDFSFIVKTIDRENFRTYPTYSKDTNPLSFNFANTLTFSW